MGANGATAGCVLVVSATRVNRALVLGQLGPHGFALEEAADGRTALLVAGDAPPDVVLLDAELPGEDALEVLDRFKGSPDLAHVPVVLVSHRTASEDVATGLERGAHDYLRKPVEPSELVARVMGAIRLKVLQDRLRATNAQLRHTAGTDALTRLPNRRTAADQIERLVARARRHELSFAVVLADVDGFKSVNDAHGHAVGDAALVGIAGRMAAVCRCGDLLARWGGDELIVLTDGDDAQALAARLRDAVASTPVEAAGRELALTVSTGWSGWRRGDEAGAVLSRADRALYAGRAAAQGDGAASG